jgi:hypothetical protein
VTGDGPAETRIRETHTEEPRKECGPNHELAQRDVDVAAKSAGCDLVLFRLDSGEWALVHLTWTANQPGWPRVEAIGMWDVVVTAAVEHAQLHS